MGFLFVCFNLKIPLIKGKKCVFEEKSIDVQLGSELKYLVLARNVPSVSNKKYNVKIF